jgi:hypothetical protein
MDVLEDHNNRTRSAGEIFQESREKLVPRDRSAKTRGRFEAQIGSHIEKRAEWRRRRERIASTPQKIGALLLPPDKLFQQGRLPYAGFSGYCNETSLVPGVLERLFQRSQWFVALEKRRHRSGRAGFYF